MWVSTVALKCLKLLSTQFSLQDVLSPVLTKLNMYAFFHKYFTINFEGKGEGEG